MGVELNKKDTHTQTLLLIDANSLVHRCFHAIPPLNAPDGTPSNALYGLANILYRLFETIRPDYAAAAFDRPEPTFRKKQYDAYKAHRPATPSDLIVQLEEAKNLCRAFGVYPFEKPGFEADDIIATLATVTAKTQKNVRTVVFTGDLDAVQLVQDDAISVCTFKKGISETITYDEKAVRDRYGIPPTRIIDYKAFVGDTSDNIPGVPGIGPKTATTLIQAYGTAEDILGAARAKNAGISAALQEKIVNNAHQLMRAKELVTAKRDVEIDTDLQKLQTHQAVAPEAVEYCKKFGFESLLVRMHKKQTTTELKKETVKKTSTTSPESTKETRTPKTKQSSLFANARHSTPLTISAGTVLTDTNPDPKQIEGDTNTKIGFDIKTTVKNIWSAGTQIAGPYYDLGIAFWLLNPDAKDLSPQTCAQKFLKSNWHNEAEDYEKAHAFTEEQFKKLDLEHVFKDIEMKVLPVLAQMETWGIAVSKQKLQTLEQEIEKELRVTEKNIYKHAGEEFNINSPQQLSGVLFQKLRIQTKKTSKNKQGNLSTDAAHLEEIQDQHPIVAEILRYREDFKIQSTYVRALQGLIDNAGRIHTQYFQIGTGTGRLSSKDPNLQNIPQESKWSRALRHAFVAEKGKTLVSLDYTQLELRILAAVTKDPQLLEAFAQNQDIHTRTAQAVLGIPADKITKEDRRIAKTLNFGLIYGMGPTAFAKATGFSRTQAQEFIAKYFAQFPTVKQWQQELLRGVRATGYAVTLTGRRRSFPGISSGMPQFVAAAERAALNFPLQGLGADILKTAMIQVARVLQEKNWWGIRAKMLLTIHDELLLEVADDMIEEVARVVRENMQDVMPQLPVALTVDVSTGKNWGDMEKMKL